MKAPVHILSIVVALTAAVAAAQAPPADCPMHKDHDGAAATPQTTAPEHAHHDHAMSPYAGSPYAGEEGTDIKALTVEEIKAYREGTGMGLAKPAELNHYPGPRHVLDMASALKLTAAQTAEIQTIFDRMHETAVRLGREILEKEKSLDSEFSSGSIDDAKLRGLTSGIASLQAELRATHLKAHLETRKILTSAQIARYDELRGYAATSKS